MLAITKLASIKQHPLTFHLLWPKNVNCMCSAFMNLSLRIDTIFENQPLIMHVHDLQLFEQLITCNVDERIYHILVALAQNNESINFGK